MVSNERTEEVVVEQLSKCLDLCEAQTGTDAVILFYKMIGLCAYALHDVAGRDEALFALEAARKYIETRSDKSANVPDNADTSAIPGGREGDRAH